MVKKPEFKTNIKEPHDQYLENLVYHLDFVEENKEDIEWILKDGLWRRKAGRIEYNTLCDLIVIHSEYGVPIELKGQSVSQRRKARNQIISGKKFLEEILNIPVPYGKLVLYSPEGYKYRKYYFMNDGTTSVGDWKFAPFK